MRPPKRQVVESRFSKQYRVWVLTGECGHVVTRHVKRRVAFIPPVHIRCYRCLDPHARDQLVRNRTPQTHYHLPPAPGSAKERALCGVEKRMHGPRLVDQVSRVTCRVCHQHLRQQGLTDS